MYSRHVGQSLGPVLLLQLVRTDLPTPVYPPVPPIPRCEPSPHVLDSHNIGHCPRQHHQALHHIPSCRSRGSLEARVAQRHPHTVRRLPLGAHGTPGPHPVRLPPLVAMLHHHGCMRRAVLMYSSVPKNKCPSFWGVFEAVRVRLGRPKAITGLGGAVGGIRGIPFHTFFTPPGHLPGTARNKSQKPQFRLKMYFSVPAAFRDASRAFAMPRKGGHGNECTGCRCDCLRFT